MNSPPQPFSTNLPLELTKALQEACAKIPSSKLAAATQELSRRYRSECRDLYATFMTSDIHRIAYLAFRMPATYAAIYRVFLEIKTRIPGLEVTNFIDAGAGPGTATWAATTVFPNISKALLIENDPHWISIGEQLLQVSPRLALQKATYQHADLSTLAEFQKNDFIVLAYVVGELKLETLPSLVEKLLTSSQGIIVVIEPGTPHGFERIRIMRQLFINAGRRLIAPCPHEETCPMSQGDWCHFAERLERSSVHRSAKEVTLGYEDEKFSYVACAPYPLPLPEARILRHPQKHSGHIDFMLCTKEGLEKRILSKRHGELYKYARKLEWGDTLKLSSE